jgi:hypothetical protein
MALPDSTVWAAFALFFVGLAVRLALAERP